MWRTIFLENTFRQLVRLWRRDFWRSASSRRNSIYKTRTQFARVRASVNRARVRKSPRESCAHGFSRRTRHSHACARAFAPATRHSHEEMVVRFLVRAFARRARMSHARASANAARARSFLRDFRVHQRSRRLARRPPGEGGATSRGAVAYPSRFLTWPNDRA